MNINTFILIVLIYLILVHLTLLANRKYNLFEPLKIKNKNYFLTFGAGGQNYIDYSPIIMFIINI